jgi:hypothetical protein
MPDAWWMQVTAQVTAEPTPMRGRICSNRPAKPPIHEWVECGATMHRILRVPDRVDASN